MKSCPDELFLIRDNQTCVSQCTGEYPYEDTSSGQNLCVSRCGSGYYFVNGTRRECQDPCSDSDSFWHNTSFSDNYTQCMPECQDYVPFHRVGGKECFRTCPEEYPVSFESSKECLASCPLYN